MNRGRAPTLNERTATVIRGKMAAQKRTILALAQQLEISRQAAGRKVRGNTAITLDELDVISEWLGATPAEIMGEAEKWKSQQSPP